MSQIETSKKTSGMFENLKQICLVTNDMEKTLAAITEVFGWIDPVSSSVLPVHGVKYYREDHGTSADFRFFYFGGIEFEIIHPTGGKSVWQDFIDKRGPGLHHMIFDIEDFDAVEAHMESLGYPMGQSGDCLRPSFKGAKWAYYDTYEAFGFYTEIYNLKEKGVSPPPNYMDENKKLVSKDESLFYNPVKISCVSKDLDATMKKVQQAFGWNLHGTSDIEANDAMYCDETANYKAKKASYLVNGIEFEFVCPQEGESVWQDYANARGEGIHHLQFNVDDLSAVDSHMKAIDVKNVQSGLCSCNNAKWAFFDLNEKLGFYVKAVNK